MVDSHVSLVAQGIGCPQHEDHGMHHGDRLLQGDRALVEEIAHDYDGKGDDDHGEGEPGDKTPRPFVDLIDN